MLIQIQSKLNFGVTLALMLIGLSLLFSVSAQAKPPHTQVIGPEGGKIKTGHESYLFIPEYALLEPQEIYAESFDSAIATEPTLITEALEMALAKLNEQHEYINQLPKSDDGSGEWAKNGMKNHMLHKSDSVAEQIAMALEAHELENGWDTLKSLIGALHCLDELDEDISDFMSDKVLKVGLVACARIQEYSDEIREQLEIADSLYYATLLFEFGPDGTEFLIPAELVIPFDEIAISDELFWYSDDGELIDLIDMEYIIDDKNETVHFFIDHFSEYYFMRR